MLEISTRENFAVAAVTNVSIAEAQSKNTEILIAGTSGNFFILVLKVPLITLTAIRPHFPRFLAVWRRVRPEACLLKRHILKPQETFLSDIDDKFT